MVSYDVAHQQSVEYFNGDDLAANVFLTKYALKTPEGEILEETPEKMHRRLAREFARIEAKYPNPLSEEVIFSYLDGFKYIVPQGSPMAGIGNPYQVMSISNCFVIRSPYDSMSGIKIATTEEAEIMKRRGGVGLDISSIRPKGMKTANAAGSTDGIAVFMEDFSDTCRHTAQNGRRGALMLTISVHHPEIRTFISIKRDLKKVTGANISVRLSDEFMKAVKEGGKVQLRFPVEKPVEPKPSQKDPQSPESNDSPPQPQLASNKLRVEEWVDARELWDEIITSAHDSAEPGLLFWDNIISRGPADCYADVGFKTISTNPCGEITLSAYDSCRLLLVNVFNFVTNAFANNSRFEWKKFEETVVVAQRLMDDIVDLELECIDKILDKINRDPEPPDIKFIEKNLWERIRESCVNGRRTGLGLTGVGDMAAALGMKYGSEDCVAFVEHVYRLLCVNSYRSSINLAKERGAFPVFSHEKEKDHPFLEQIWAGEKELHKEYLKYGRRNIANLTTAPAGSVSICTQTTSGIENVPYIVYTRRKKKNPNDKNFRCDFVDDLGDQWQEFKVYHRGFNTWKAVNNTTDEDMQKSPYWGSTIKDVDWVAKVKLQAAAQKWIDHSISNTTNVPEFCTVSTVKDIYMTGWESGCKGVTIYREGSRAGVIVENPEAELSTDQLKDKIEKWTAVMKAEESESASKIVLDYYQSMISKFQKEIERRKKGINNTSSEGELTDHHAPKRPVELLCDVYHSTVQGEKWTIFVGKLKGKPYEVMGGLAKFVTVPKRVKHGKIVKHNGVVTPAHYDFYYDYDTGDPEDEGVVKDIGNVFENPVHSAFTRTISLALRHGAPVQYVVEQLLKGSDKDSDLFSFSKVMSRVLKNYISDGTKVHSEKSCSNCKSTNLVYQQGCVTCFDCGNSKCG